MVLWFWFALMQFVGLEHKRISRHQLGLKAKSWTKSKETNVYDLEENAWSLHLSSVTNNKTVNNNKHSGNLLSPFWWTKFV